MPPAACIAAAAEITATMISIASNGGSPGSSPKKKTRISVPTPPHRPRPIPPDRTPSAMKPTTIRPSIAISSQFVPLVSVCAAAGVGVAGSGAVVVAAGTVVSVVVVASVVWFGAAIEPWVSNADDATKPARPSGTHAIPIVR